MSFFGFDTNGPPKDKDTLNFEDTYAGLGEHSEEEEDAFNDETFGTDIKTGRDFDFGNVTSSASSSQVQPQRSYAEAAIASVDDVTKPMASLWSGSSSAQQQPQQAPQLSTGPRVLSLEEVEAQLMGRGPQQPQQPQQQQILPPQMYGQNGFPFMSPQQFQQFQQQFGNQMPPGFMFPPPPQGYPGQPAMFMPPNLPGMPQMSQGVPQVGPQVTPQSAPQQQQQLQQSQPIQQAPQTAPPVQPAPQQESAPVQKESQLVQEPVESKQPKAKENALPLDEFPVLGSAAPGQHFHQQQQPQQNQQQSYQQHQQHQQQHQQHRYQNRGGRQRQMQDLSPEERERLNIRSNKVAHITRSSGFMTARDKDFVTRFQLSQIVSQDPFSEDFYHQIFKVLKYGSSGAGDMSYIAQKYLDQSRHRLGGKERRADVALQRMQQQISQAVTVAKERGERTGTLAREGALGKVSVGTIRQPRKQLVIKHSEDELKNMKKKGGFDGKVSKFTKQAQLNSIENAYSILLNLETLERENKPISTDELFEALHVLDEGENDEHPFLSMLGYEKGMRLFSRCFHMLTLGQKHASLVVLFRNLQKLSVVLRGSYKNYESDEFRIPEAIEKKIAVFQQTVLKTLVLYISENGFQQVLEMVDELEKSNSILFLCTTKIGLSLITVLISRLELIKQEGAATGAVSVDDLAKWSDLYDKLFGNLEERLSLIFPPTKPQDDSYIWQFLASLALAGKLQHQRVIVDEVRDEIFGTMGKAKTLREQGNEIEAVKLIVNLNLFLNVMGLKASETDISEL